MEIKRKNFCYIKENLTKVKVIYTDMDGTLTDPEGCIFTAPSGKLTLIPIEAVFHVLQKKIDVVIVSGRTHSQLRENARILGFKNFIAESGCEIVYDLGKKVIYNIGDIKIEKGKSPRQIIEESGAVELLFSRFPGKIRYYYPWADEVRNNVILVGNIPVKDANLLLKEHGFSNLRLNDNGKVPPEKDFPAPHCYHLIPSATSKRSAVARDKKIRRLKREQLVGIGESVEDVEIADEVGVYFVVKNGLENNPGLSEIIKKKENVFVLDKAMGLGWAQAIQILEQMGKI